MLALNFLRTALIFCWNLSSSGLSISCILVYSLTSGLYNNMLIVITNIRKAFSYRIRSPLDLKYFRQPEHMQDAKRSMKARFKDQALIDQIHAHLDVHKKELHSLERQNKLLNDQNKSIKQLLKDGASIDSEKQAVKGIKRKKEEMEESLKQLTNKIQSMIQQVGNIVDASTPVSQHQNENKVLRTYEPGVQSLEVPYQEICERFPITDLKRGQKVSGHRGYYLQRDGLKLALALTQYALQFLESKQYALYQAPAIISESVLKESCQLSSIQQDVYRLEGEKSFLIATSQQSLAGYYKGEVLTSLPIKMGGYSTCFRKEAGAHGKDIHGIFRVHQFEKVQQFLITAENESQRQLENMMEISEQFYRSLGLPHRVVQVVSGELNDATSKKYDLEGWYPSQKRYRQLVSVSNCTDYQSRMLQVQHREKSQLRYPHMLNGTLVAIQRTITCILENYFRGDFVEVPKVLRPYMKKQRIH